MKKSNGHAMSSVRLCFIVTGVAFIFGCTQDSAPSKAIPSTKPAQEMMMNGEGEMKGDGMMKDGAMMKDDSMMKADEKLSGEKKM
jgi:hypothetical protein